MGLLASPFFFHFSKRQGVEMSKRARTKASGLGDVKPQFLTLNTSSAGPDVYAVDIITLPVARIGGSNTKAVVMELLSVDWYLAVNAIGNTLQTDAAFLSTGIWASVDHRSQTVLTRPSFPQPLRESTEMRPRTSRLRWILRAQPLSLARLTIVALLRREQCTSSSPSTST